MSPRPPLVDTRDRQAVLNDLDDHLKGYTPEWSPASGTPSAALMNIFARYMEIFIDGLNRVPERSFLGFLSLSGTQLLPAQSAQAPLVFTLMASSPVDVPLPANSQVAAQPPPRPPSPLLADETQPAAPQPLVFATTQTITLARARLAALYSLEPVADAYADHTAHATTGFTVFDAWQPIEHALYLGHNELFALAGAAEVGFSFDMGASAPNNVRRNVILDWEYLSKDGWLPLQVAEDTTARFTQDGKIVLKKDCGPDAQQDTIFDHASYWIRSRVSASPPSGTITKVQGTQLTLDAAWQFVAGDLVTIDGEERARIVTILINALTLDRALVDAAPGRRLFMAENLPPLRPQGADAAGLLPTVDVIRARVGFTKTELKPEKAFTDTAPIDTENNFYPFGQQPAPYTTFYLASKEVFQRRGARVQIAVKFAEAGAASPALQLTWEYHNGEVWKTFDPVFAHHEDGTDKLTHDGLVTFICPLDWGEATINGQKNYWLRVRIDTGDYGHPPRLKAVTQGNQTTVQLEDSNLQPPVVKKLTLQYTYFTNPTLLDHCLTYNDFVYEDHSEDCRWPRRPFQPFRPIADRQPAIHFGFDRPLPTGLLSLYLHVPPEVAENSAGAAASAFVWEYRSAQGWTELSVLDETLGFRYSGMIQFIGPRDAIAFPGLGGALYRIRARLKQGERLQPARIAGIWCNAVWGTQRLVFERDVLGTSDGNAGQTLSFLRRQGPVLEGEVVEVCEWSGRGADWETAVQDVPPLDRRFDTDPVTGTATAVWVRWYERPHLYSSGPTDRHYVIERVSGLLRFGDGRYGLIPPAGSRIVASYSSGGGLAGNVPAGAISELRTGVPYLQEVTNPVPATGGAASETPEAVQARGPQRLHHRDRAVSVMDLAWLAREASPAVARARCLPITGPIGHAQRGWVTLIIVPHSTEDQPQPTSELQRRVREYLARRVPATVAHRVRVVGPQYTPISVVAEIVPRHPDDAAQVEARVRDRVQHFLHPLTGGPDNQGWAFGQAIYLSHIAAVIEHTPGVDYTLRLGLRVHEQIFDEYVPVDPDTLVAIGVQELKLTLGEM